MRYVQIASWTQEEQLSLIPRKGLIADKGKKDPWSLFTQYVQNQGGQENGIFGVWGQYIV